MMTHNKYFFFFFLILTTTFYTCESDYQLDIPDNGRKIVINGFLSTDDTITIQVFESKFILDSNIYYRPLKNPIVQLWIDNQYIENLQCRYSRSLFSQYKIDSISYISSQKPVPDRTYSIKVLHPDFPEAVANVKMPETVLIDKTDTVHMVNRFEKYYSIRFNDSSVESNYYFIKFFVPLIGLNHSCDTIISITEKEFTAEFLYYDKFCFSDKLFNGKNAEVRYIFPSVIQNSVFTGVPTMGFNCPMTVFDKIVSRKMYIKLYSCSEEFYRYYKSYRTIIERGDDVFYEPVKIYSNVKNGYGILAAYSTSVDSSIYIQVRSFTW